MDTLAALVIAASALILGVVLGIVLRDPKRALHAVIGAVTTRTIALLVIGSVIIAALVALSDHESPQLWAQLISLTALTFVTLALFATGECVYSPKRQVVVSKNDKETTYTVGSVLTQTEYDALVLAGKDEQFTKQRGLFFRGLYTGADGRWSTSKLQPLLWTFAVLYGLLAIFLATQIGGDAFKLDQGEGKGTTFGGLEFDDQYLLLLGGYFAAAIAAKGITTSQVEGGATVKEQTTETRGPAQGAKDIVSNDANQTDIGDLQFFFFNLLALAVFFVSFIPNLEKGMPDLPWFLVGMTSVSALAYVGKKSLSSASPEITSITPSKARPKDPIRIVGSYLASSLESKPTVTIDGEQAAPPVVRSVTGPFGEQSVLQVTVPEHAEAGEGKVVSVTPQGGKPVEGTIEILGSVIAAVTPTPVPWRPFATLSITGHGFGTVPGEVTLGPIKLHPDDWRDGVILASTHADVSGAPPTENLILELVREGVSLASKSVPVELGAMAITGVDPSALTLVEHAAVSIAGIGFGQVQGVVELNGQALTPRSWSDTQIVAVLGMEFPPATPPAATLALVVQRPGDVTASAKVAASSPAVVVSEVYPSEIAVQEGAIVTIIGSGFGLSGPLEVRIGEVKLKLGSEGRSETLLQATLGAIPPEVAKSLTDTGQLARLVVMRERWQTGYANVTLRKPTA